MWQIAHKASIAPLTQILLSDTSLALVAVAACAIYLILVPMLSGARVPEVSVTGRGRKLATKSRTPCSRPLITAK